MCSMCVIRYVGVVFVVSVYVYIVLFNESAHNIVLGGRVSTHDALENSRLKYFK